MPPSATGAEAASDGVSGATLLQLMWLASPALPVGSFSYSEGLEAAVEAGRVSDEASARDWLCDQLRLGLARSELPVLAQALDAWRAGDLARVQALNAWVGQTRETSELRQQAEQMGRSLFEWLRHGPQADDARLQQLRTLSPAPTWPVAFALAAALTQAPPREVLQAYAFGWAENQTQAALKAVPLGQIAGQGILRAVSALIPEVVEAALVLPDEARQAYTPMLAILSGQHETQYSRLFRS